MHNRTRASRLQQSLGIGFYQALRFIRNHGQDAMSVAMAGNDEENIHIHDLALAKEIGLRRKKRRRR
jgi:hypothetical protein